MFRRSHGPLAARLPPAPTAPASPSYLPLAPPSQVEISASYCSKPKVFSISMREFEAVHHFVFDLLRRAEDVRVVLRESAHAQQPVHRPAALVAIHRAQLAQPHRQLAIAAQLVAIDQDVARAVHGLEPIFGVVQLHAA